MTTFLTAFIGVVTGAFISVLESRLQLLSEARKDKRIKVAELVTALGIYIDYMITVTWYPLEKLRLQNDDLIIDRLVALKGDVIKTQTLLAAYDFKRYDEMKLFVKESVSIDEELSDLIFNTEAPSEEFDKLNDRLLELITQLHASVARVMG